MTEIEKLRLELVELKLESLFYKMAPNEFELWKRLDRQEKNFLRIKEIEEILNRVSKEKDN